MLNKTSKEFFCFSRIKEPKNHLCIVLDSNFSWHAKLMVDKSFVPIVDKTVNGVL